jgi:hypothetical protein
LFTKTMTIDDSQDKYDRQRHSYKIDRENYGDPHLNLKRYYRCHAVGSSAKW